MTDGVAISPKVSSDANAVIAHILTKSSDLSIRDITVLQESLMQTGDAKFNKANGTFGEGTAKAVKEYLQDNGQLVSRLGEGVKASLAAQGVAQDSLNPLSKTVNIVKGNEVKQILAQPYAVSREEIAVLNRALSGAKEGSAPDYTFGPKFRSNLEKFIQRNPDTVVENASVIAKIMRDSERFGDDTRVAFEKKKGDFLENVFADSKGFRKLVNDLIERKTDGVSSTNYRLETLLNISGYKSGQPDGFIDKADLDAIKEFKRDSDARSKGLTSQWKPEGTDQTVAVTVENPSAKVDAVIKPS